MKHHTINPEALYWATFNRIQFRLPGEAVIDLSASGPVDDAADYWQEPVRKLTAGLYADDIANPWNPTAEKLREELSEYGAWSDEELSDDAANWRRIIWIAANNIADEDCPDCSQPLSAVA
jgi:hypothetical protein